jgi:hypothetical protein
MPLSSLMKFLIRFTFLSLPFHAGESDYNLLEMVASLSELISPAPATILRAHLTD